MRQVLFTIPGVGIKIFGFGTMLFLAFLASMYLAAWRARREKLDPDTIYDMVPWVFIGGLIGARVFFVFQYWGDKIKSVADIFTIWEGGIVFYGSIIGGTAAFFLYWYRRPFPLRAFLDVVAPSLAVGMMIGRLGCFLNGCCYGDRCDNLPWAIAFPRLSPPWWAQHNAQWIGADAAWSLPVHPTQLYAAIDGLVLFFLLSAYYPLRRRDGEVMALLMVTYPVTRFLVEYLRSDEGVFFAGLTVSQNVSILVLLGGLAFWQYLLRQPAQRVADQPEPVAAEAV
jgi:phosphatidylglycerol:prolipoprotein diacylglycerol transferase